MRWLWCACLISGCSGAALSVDGGAPDAGPARDAGTDAGTLDAGTPDAGTPDAGSPDAGTVDAGKPDAGTPDAGKPDAGPVDAGVSCALSTCDAVGIWPITAKAPDGGLPCAGYLPMPPNFTISRDGGALCFDPSYGLTSDGGCGFTVRYHFWDPEMFDPKHRQHVFQLEFDGNTFSGTDEVYLNYLLQCRETLTVSGMR